MTEIETDKPLMSVGVMYMFVGVTNFGQVQKIRFVVVKIFRSNCNQFLVVLIRSSELALNYTAFIMI